MSTISSHCRSYFVPVDPCLNRCDPSAEKMVTFLRRPQDFSCTKRCGHFIQVTLIYDDICPSWSLIFRPLDQIGVLSEIPKGNLVIPLVVHLQWWPYGFDPWLGSQGLGKSPQAFVPRETWIEDLGGRPRCHFLTKRKGPRFNHGIPTGDEWNVKKYHCVLLGSWIATDISTLGKSNPILILIRINMIDIYKWHINIQYSWRYDNYKI